MANIRIISVNFVMLSQVVINQGNFALQNRAENVVQTVVHCFSIIPTNKLKTNKIIPLSQSPLGMSGWAIKWAADLSGFSGILRIFDSKKWFMPTRPGQRPTFTFLFVEYSPYICAHAISSLHLI